MRIAYFDCLSGASGDMILASLIDAGVEISDIYEVLQGLSLGKFNVSTHRVQKGGISGLRFQVEFEEEPEHERTLGDITRLIEESELARDVKVQSLEIFCRLAEAEAEVHDTSADQVHFHEVGALDSIVDIVGAVVGLSMLDVEDVCFGPLALGSGSVTCRHGTIPVPAPATLQLVKGFRVVQTDTNGEMLTPTGASILTSLGTQGAVPSDMVLAATGCGAGSAERESGRPNVLRVLVGETIRGMEDTSVLMMEANIDDMSPELYPSVFEKLLAAGALDVTATPVLMKKGRPGHLLSVMVEEDRRAAIEEVLFRHTTTFGLRCARVERSCLERAEDVVDTPYGPVKIKKAFYGGSFLRAAPEYEDCMRVAEENGISLREVYEAVAARTCREAQERS